MSNVWGKIWSKLIAVIIIVLFIVGFRELILTDTYVSAVFKQLMGALPFAKQIADIICKIMKYNISNELITSAGVIEDFLKLAIMACIQPLVVGFITALFLKVPKGNSYEMEEYMNGTGYKIKEMIITLVTAPFIAVAVAYLTSRISDYFTDQFGPVLSTIFGIAAVILIAGLSLIPLLMSKVGFGTAVVWRLLVTLFGKMIITMGIDVLCIWIYLAITSGKHSTAFAFVIALIAWLIVTDLGMTSLKKAIVS